MGVFTKGQENQSSFAYDRMKQYLKHDGKIHVAMVNSFSKLGNQNLDCDDKYTTEIDNIISSMQNDGYEIISVVMNSMAGQGLTGNRTGFHTLITYK
jgi:hypothetical protein